VFTVWKLTKPIVVLCGYEVVKDALVNHGEHFSDRPPLPTSDIFGYGNVDLFRRFMLSTLRSYGMAKRPWRMKSTIFCSFSLGGAFNPIYLLGFAVYSTISSIMFGENLDYKDPKLYGLIRVTRNHNQGMNSNLYQICNTFPILLHLPFVKEKVIHPAQEMKQIVLQYTQKHRESIDLNTPRDLLDSWLVKLKEESHPGSPFNETGFIVYISGLLGAATDTTSSSLTFCLLMMAYFPEVQERVQREIDEVVEHERFPEMKDRTQLSYTNAVIHECQRTLDLAPIAHYHAAVEDIQFRGFLIPKGTTIIPFLTSVLSDPAHWKNPEDFDPDNFLDDEGQFKPNPAFLPFSAGPRSCLGENLARMELFLIISALLQKFTFRKPAGSKPIDFNYVRNNKITFLVSSKVYAAPRTVDSRRE
uniref:Cytochrome P450 n=1 Tax=Leptobrachium leishanense TaxID=445787 RepID=A0A8C5PZJ5_9ANUR